MHVGRYVDGDERRVISVEPPKRTLRTSTGAEAALDFGSFIYNIRSVRPEALGPDVNSLYCLGGRNTTQYPAAETAER